MSLMVLNIKTYRSCLTVQTQIGLQSEGRSDCGLHSLHFHLGCLNLFVYNKSTVVKLKKDYCLFGVGFFGGLLWYAFYAWTSEFVVFVYLFFHSSIVYQ